MIIYNVETRRCEKKNSFEAQRNVYILVNIVVLNKRDCKNVFFCELNYNFAFFQLYFYILQRKLIFLSALNYSIVLYKICVVQLMSKNVIMCCNF